MGEEMTDGTNQSGFVIGDWVLYREKNLIGRIVGNDEGTDAWYVNFADWTGVTTRIGGHLLERLPVPTRSPE